MSTVTPILTDKEKKRPSVSSKCLLSIKTIVTQNVASNRNNKTPSLCSPTSVLPPLPLVNSSVQSNNHSNETKIIEEKLRNKPETLSNRNVLTEKLSKSDLRKSPKKQSIHEKRNQTKVSNGGEQKSSVIESPRISTCKKEQEINYHSDKPVVTEVSSNILQSVSLNESTIEHCSSVQTSASLTNTESPIVPPLPLNCSMYPFNSSSSSHHVKPLVSFPTQSSNRINEEYLTRMRRIIESSPDANEIKPIELSIHHRQSLPIRKLDFASPTISTIDDDNEDAAINLNNPLVFVNRSLNLSATSKSAPLILDQTITIKTRLSEHSETEIHKNRKVMNHHLEPNPRCSTSYTRLPHSLRNKNPTFNSPGQSVTFRSPIFNNSPAPRQFPQLESVRTPVQKPLLTNQEPLSKIPSELFDCCQTATVCVTTEIIQTQRYSNQRHSQRSMTSIENGLNESEARSNYFRDVAKIREIMINVSKRLTKDNDSLTSFPIVDTHCHFDLIFDRLHIKHNNLKKYFLDYNEYYPSGISFELAIQVFWRPKQLMEDNWNNWYSKYLYDERVYGACGIHPHWSSAWNETSSEDIERCLQHPKIVALGEIGLDYGPKNVCSNHEQCRAFEAQLKLAAKWLKPIVIHSRNAYQDTFKLMKQYLAPDHKIHLHCFVGTMDDINLFTSYFNEIKFGFTPIITRTDFLHKVIQQLDLTQILSETDSPYFMPDELSKFSRCAHPGMVYSVVEMVAQLRHLPVMNVALQLRENARHIYGV